MEKITYSEKEAAKAIGISESELKKQREERKITFLIKKGGKKILYTPKAIQEYLSQNYQEYKATPQ